MKDKGNIQKLYVFHIGSLFAFTTQKCLTAFGEAQNLLMAFAP